MEVKTTVPIEKNSIPASAHIKVAHSGEDQMDEIKPARFCLKDKHHCADELTYVTATDFLYLTDREGIGC